MTRPLTSIVDWISYESTGALKRNCFGKHHRFSSAYNNNRVWVFLFNVNRVLKLDPVLLTQEDLHRIGLTKRNRLRRHPDYPFTIIAGYKQGGSGGLTIQYWLFDSSSSAKKAAEAGWPWFFTAVPNFQPERNPENIIGGATGRNIHRSPREWENDKTDIYFVKYNLLVSVRAVGHGHLQYARDIAQHIDTKIEAVLKRK